MRRLSPAEHLEQWFADRLSVDGEHDLDALRRACVQEHVDDAAFLQALGRAVLSQTVTRAQRAAIARLRQHKRTIEAGRFLRVADRQPRTNGRAWWRPFADDYHVPFVDLRRPDLRLLEERASRAGREAIWAAVYFHQLAELLPDDRATVGDAIRPQTRLELEAEIERRVTLALRDRHVNGAQQDHLGMITDHTTEKEQCRD